uniref:TPR_MLP1_2 domain-containing protein n=1 Tax=Rhabditophanes sp. KR3021 TaxID=114890 RepID=A0AC35TYD5_9BILA
MDELESLRQEKERLSEALQQANEQKILAAQHGLNTLNEKQQIEQALGELKERYVQAANEVVTLRESLENYQKQISDAKRSEFNQEEKRLEETSDREADLKHKLSVLESEKKKLTADIAGLTSENETLGAALSTAKEREKDLEKQREVLKADLKDIKSREQTLQNDFNELEADNTSLQKQVSNLSSRQKEFDSMRFENKSLVQENLLCKNALDEANNLQMIAERQLDEALLQSAHEREQKLNLKNELERMKNNEQRNHLNWLVDIRGNDSESDQSSVLNNLERSFMEPGSLGQSLGAEIGGNDLFSEISNDANKKVSILEKQLQDKNNENSDLKKSYVRAILPVLKGLNVPSASENIDLDYLQELCIAAVGKLNENSSAKAVGKELEKEIDNIKNIIREVIILGGKKNAEFKIAQESLYSFADQMNTIYNKIVGDQDFESNRHVKEIANKLKAIDLASSRTKSKSDSNGEKDDFSLVAYQVFSDSYVSEIEKLLSPNKLDAYIEAKEREEDLDISSNQTFNKIYEYTQDLVKIVQRTVENTSATETPTEVSDVQEIISQNMKLKSQLATKRDQIVTLRTVLKCNKTAAEEAFVSLRDKYEHEKNINHEIITSIRDENKHFKEEAATFVANRAMFHSKNEELKSEVKMLKEKLVSAEEEKKTINHLLRMAIAQKFNLTQKVEDLEMEREKERQAFKRGKQNGRASTTGSTETKEVKTVRYPSSGAQAGSGGSGGSSSQHRTHKKEGN